MLMRPAVPAAPEAAPEAPRTGPLLARGEYHAFNPDVVTALITCARTGDYEDYKTFARMVNERPVATLRDLLDLRLGTAIPIDQVEPIEAITARFDCAGMSLGALSPATASFVTFDKDFVNKAKRAEAFPAVALCPP